MGTQPGEFQRLMEACTTNPDDVITKTQLELFGAQIMERFDARIQQVINQLARPTGEPNQQDNPPRDQPPNRPEPNGRRPPSIPRNTNERRPISPTSTSDD